MKTSMNSRTCRMAAGCSVLALSAALTMAHEAEPIASSPVGIPYAWAIQLEAQDSSETAPDHVGAWSWDEDANPDTARGWTHTSKWVKLDLTEPAKLTLRLRSLENVPWPSQVDTNRVAGTNLFPSFSLYRGWDTDVGLKLDTNGVTIDQEHMFNNRGNIEWAEDVTYLDHLDNSTAHNINRTWVLPSGQYSINLGGNSPATQAEGRQGYKAVFLTSPASINLTNAVLSNIEFSEVGVPYGIGLVLGSSAYAETLPDHVGAWSWDEDSFPDTARGWTHTTKFVKLKLLEPARFTLTLSSLSDVPWPSSTDPGRMAGTNLFPSFTIYQGWDTDAGVRFSTNGVTIDQDHTFNNRGNIEWAEDISYLDHVENSTEHSVARTWLLPAGDYTINLGGNSPSAQAEGRQGFKAVFVTQPISAPLTNAVLSNIEFSEVGVPYSVGLVMNDSAYAESLPDHVGAWSWDEDANPETARG